MAEKTSTKPRGRPVGDGAEPENNARLHIRLRSEMLERLDRLADRQNMTAAELARKWLGERIDEAEIQGKRRRARAA